jgi:hypothetical protein
MNRILLLLFLLLIIPLISVGQTSLWNFSLEGQTVATPANKLPFWLRADQNGSIPLSGASVSGIASIYRSYDTARKPFIDWSTGLQVRANAGNTSNLTLIEGYIKGKMGILQIQGGRTKDMTGLVDSSLSTGAFAISGNALGIPKIGISIPDYYSLKFTNDLIAVKAAYSAGYLGDVQLIKYSTNLTNNPPGFYQENELYGRFGRPNWRLKIYAGINHHVMFDDERKVQGPNYTLNMFQTFVYAATGRTYNHYSKVGNHIGSVDLAVQYEFDKSRLFIYRQNLYDEGALAHLANIADGITGISLTNKNPSPTGFTWRKILFEQIYTVNQAGYFNSPYTKSGDENYYNNPEYKYGWSYYGVALGNPLLVTPQYTRKGFPIAPGDYFISNRVSAFHLAAMGSAFNLDVTTRFTYSINYGDFATSPEGNSLGKIHTQPIYGLFQTVNEFSWGLDVGKHLSNGYNVGVSVAGDAGSLYYNSVGAILKVKKVF